MVLAALQIRSLGKILKPWYACSVAENATLSDVYNEFSSGILDQGMPLAEKYQTVCATASIGRTPQQLTRISCSVQVAEAVSSLGMYIEFNIAATCDNEGLQRQSAVQPETSAVNAFTILMSASKTKSSVPAKYDITQPNAKLKLKNDMIDWLSENKLGRENAYTETIGRTFVTLLLRFYGMLMGIFRLYMIVDVVFLRCSAHFRDTTNLSCGRREDATRAIRKHLSLQRIQVHFLPWPVHHT